MVAPPFPLNSKNFAAISWVRLLASVDEKEVEQPEFVFPLTDDFAAIAPRISGGLSTISSSLIIYMILRSETKISTIYHRLMFGMSCADILSSLAMGLSTLPMPREGELRPGVRECNWSGTRLGNVDTCTAQGFFFVFGLVCMFSYNTSLCTYYTVAIAFQMTEKKIKKYVEPFLHIVPLTVALSVALVPIFFDAYNPTGFEAWCTIFQSKYDARFRTTIQTLVSVAIGMMLSLIIVMFSFIIWRVFKIRRILDSVVRNTNIGEQSRYQQRDNDDISYDDNSESNNQDEQISDHDGMSRIQACQQNTKVVVVQALAYITAFLISLICPFIRSLIIQQSHLLWLTRLQIVLMPLQGFFNAIIFISHKIYNYYHVHQNLSICRILSLIFKGYQEPVVLSRISLVRYDQEQTRLDVSLENERKIEVMSFDVSGSGLNVQIDGQSNNDLSGFSKDLGSFKNDALSSKLSYDNSRSRDC